MLRIKLALIVLFGLSCAGAGAYVWHKTHDIQPIDRIVVKEIEKVVYKTIKPVDNNDIEDLRNRAHAKINLSHTEKGSTITVLASDGYKESTAKYEIGQKPNYTGEIITGAAVAVVVGYCIYKLSKGKSLLLNIGSYKF